MNGLSEYVANQVGLRMVRLLKTRGAKPDVIARGERLRSEMLEEAFDGNIVYTQEDNNEIEIDRRARFILKAHAAADEKELREYEKKTPKILTLIAKLIYLKDYKSMKEFLKIVREL